MYILLPRKHAILVYRIFPIAIVYKFMEKVLGTDKSKPFGYCGCLRSYGERTELRLS